METARILSIQRSMLSEANKRSNLRLQEALNLTPERKRKKRKMTDNEMETQSIYSPRRASCH
jgi:hypothetical protein